MEPVFQLKMKSTDRSLRLLTTTIKGMKQWAAYKDRLPLLFEVFGMYLSLQVDLCSTRRCTSCVDLILAVFLLYSSVVTIIQLLAC